MPLALSLLDRGADPNVLDAGFTPLHWAAGTWENGLANPGLRVRRSGRRHSGSRSQAAARQGAAGARREPESADDGPTTGIRRHRDGRLQRRRRRDAVHRRRQCRRRGDDAHSAGRGRGSASRHRRPTPTRCSRRPVSIAASAKSSTTRIGRSRRSNSCSTWVSTRRPSPRTTRMRCSVPPIAAGTG